MKSSTWAFAVIVLLVATSLILIKNRNETRAVGAELHETIDIEFNKTDLKVCCQYNEGNEIKTCRILKKYDCSICLEKCS